MGFTLCPSRPTLSASIDENPKTNYFQNVKIWGKIAQKAFFASAWILSSLGESLLVIYVSVTHNSGFACLTECFLQHFEMNRSKLNLFMFRCKLIRSKLCCFNLVCNRRIKIGNFWHFHGLFLLIQCLHVALPEFT